MRRSPRRHQVKGHKRKGRPVKPYERGKGDSRRNQSKRRVVVGKKEDTSKRSNWYREQYLKLDNDFKEPNMVTQVPENIWKLAYLKEKTSPKENFLRYIDVTYLDCPVLDNMLENPEYFRKNKGTVFEIKLVFPDEYFKLAAEVRRSRGRTSSARQERANVDDDLARKHADKMASGDKYPLPYLDYDYGNQEGRHRARALEMLGAKWMPVMIVTEVG